MKFSTTCQIIIAILSIAGHLPAVNAHLRRTKGVHRAVQEASTADNTNTINKDKANKAEKAGKAAKTSGRKYNDDEEDTVFGFNDTNTINNDKADRTTGRKYEDDEGVEESKDREDVNGVDEGTIVGFNEVGEVVFVDEDNEEVDDSEEFAFEDPEAWDRIVDSFVPGNPVGVNATDNKNDQDEEAQMLDREDEADAENTEDGIVNTTVIAMPGSHDPILVSDSVDIADNSTRRVGEEAPELETRITELEFQMEKAMQILALQGTAINNLAAATYGVAEEEEYDTPAHLTGLNPKSDP